MATIKLKSKATGSGAPTTLAKSEPAFDLANKRLYTASDALNNIVEIGTEPSELACSGAVAFTGATSVKSFVSHTIKDNESTNTDPSAVEIKPIDGRVVIDDYLDLSGRSPATSTGGDGRNALTFTYRPTFKGDYEGEGNWKSQIVQIWNYTDTYPDAGGAFLSVDSPGYLFQDGTADPTKGGCRISLVSTSGLPRNDGFSTTVNTAQIIVDPSVGVDDDGVISLLGDSIVLGGSISLSDSPLEDVSGSISLQDWEYFASTLTMLNLTGNTTIDCPAFASTYGNTIRMRIVRNGYTLSFSNIDEWIGGAPTFNANTHYIEIQRYFNFMTARQLGTA